MNFKNFVKFANYLRFLKMINLKFSIYAEHQEQLQMTVTSDNGRNLRLLMAWSNFLDQTFNAFLESAILGCVDERIDTAVGDHQ